MTELTHKGHQAEDFKIWQVLWTALMLVVLSIILVAVAYGLLRYRRTTLSKARQLNTASYPVDQVSTVRTGQFRQKTAGESLAEQQRAALHRYSFRDRERGLVSIPIDVAIDLELEQERTQ